MLLRFIRSCSCLDLNSGSPKSWSSSVTQTNNLSTLEYFVWLQEISIPAKIDDMDLQILVGCLLLRVLLAIGDDTGWNHKNDFIVPDPTELG